MKKIVGTIAAIALAASSAFAGVNVGMGFNRAIFTPFAMGTNSEPEMVTCVSWGGAPRVGVSFSAAGEQIGVVGDIKLDGIKNPDQFAQALVNVVKDYSKVQKVLQAATVDLVAGKSIKDINRF